MITHYEISVENMQRKPGGYVPYHLIVLRLGKIEFYKLNYLLLNLFIANGRKLKLLFIQQIVLLGLKCPKYN
jgi:hypothetical protein